MILSAVVAITKNGVIGKEGGLPWYLPADLRHFKEITMGHPIIMGRKTYESIGKALPGRQNIIITRNSTFHADGCNVVGSLDEALELVKGEDEAFVIGGQSIFEIAIPKLNRIYLTKIGANIDGDKYFIYNPADWQETAQEKHAKDDRNHYVYEFLTLERKRK